MEQSRKEKVTQTEGLQHQPDLEKDLENFLNEGNMYLALTNDLYECFKRSSKIVTIMLETLDIYTRRKIQLREDAREIYEIWGNDDDEDENFEVDMIGWLDDSDSDEENVENGDTEEDDDVDDDLDDVEQEFFEILVEDYAKWRKDVSYRNIALAKIELQIQNLIVQIQMLYADVIPRIRVSLYSLLTDYCDRARLFLRVYARKRREWRNNKRDPMSGLGCEFDLLKQLLARVGEKRRCMTK